MATNQPFPSDADAYQWLRFGKNSEGRVFAASLGAKDRHAGVLPNISHSEASQLGWHREGIINLRPLFTGSEFFYFITLLF